MRPVTPAIRLADLKSRYSEALARDQFRAIRRRRAISGRADFGLWIEQLSSFYEQKTGMRLYPGTLNVELPSPYSLPRDVIRLEADEYGGTLNPYRCQLPAR